MKARVKFRKSGAMKFIGHLDIMRYFQKAIRRADLPIAYSGGYSPHMIMSFANPLGVGITGDGEYFDIELSAPISSSEAIRRLNEAMVEGTEILNFVEIPEEQKTGMSIVAAADYLAVVDKGILPEDWEEKVLSFCRNKEIWILKKTKKKEIEVDIRPMIYELSLKGKEIFMRLAAGSTANLKPDLVMESLFEASGLNTEAYHCSYHRLEVYAESEGNDGSVFVPLDTLGKVI